MTSSLSFQSLVSSFITNEYQEQILISETLLAIFSGMARDKKYSSKYIGKVKLVGKEQKVKIFGLSYI